MLSSLYEERVLPRLTDWVCRSNPVHRQRQKVVPRAQGAVLEIGFGSGLNLSSYDPERVRRVWALEPSAGMRERAAERVAEAPFEVRWLPSSGEEIPLDAASVDTVVTTYTLCSIPDVAAALSGMRRVLRPGGSLLFCEHGLAPDRGVERWQRRLTPAWSRLGGGCRLDLPIPRLIEDAGFDITALDTMYLPGTLRVLGFNYWGEANAAR